MAKRKRRSNYTRKKDTREQRKTFLIVCEGEKTEPNYFTGFRVPKKVCKIVGTGHNTLSLVKKALKLAKETTYDQVWVVMDKDDFSVDQFNQALHHARKNNILVAYSNEAFELWYLLHFNYHDVAISRATYKERLSKELGFTYQKNNGQMFHKLAQHTPKAIKYAERLLANYGNNPDPAHNNPSTTVHLLVQALQKHTI